MPRPSILPQIDWPRIFESGLEYNAWLQAAESAEQREKMEAEYEKVRITEAERAWLTALPRPVHIIAIAEDWCGDVVQHAPVLGKIAEAAPNLRVRFITRESAPDLFVR